MTPAAKIVAGGKVLHDRDSIITALRDYAEVYGPAFTSAAFNPSTAKWRDQPELIDRYYQGNPKTGEPWPSLNTIVAPFGGRFNAARVAAGLPANRPGPSRGKRAAHKHAPIRDVRIQRVPVASTAAPKPERELVVDDRRVRELERELVRAQARLAKATEKSSKAATRLHDARGRARTSATELRRKSEALAAAVARESELRERMREQGRELVVALRDRDRATGALAAARAEVTRLTVLHDDELTVLRAKLERAEADAELVSLADPEELERARDEVQEARARVADADRLIRAAEDAAAEDRRARERAEADAARARREADAERAMRAEVQAAVTGHDRQLTVEELAELRARGPAGAAVFAAAVKRVARANAKGAREPLRSALREVAAAAVRWADRL